MRMNRFTCWGLLTVFGFWGIAPGVVAEPKPADEDAEAMLEDVEPTLGGGLSAVELSLFGNVDFVAAGEAGDGSGFESGALDLFFTSQLGPRWSALVELVLETGEDDEVVVDPERFRIAYDHSDLLRLEFGRMHNSLVRWNVEQHHGVYLQTSVSKPLLTEWEDDHGLWPVHVVGARISGTAHRAAGLHYEVTVANGRGETLDDIQVGGDANDDKAMVVSLGVAPPSWRGLRLTATGYFDDVPAPTLLSEDAYALALSYVEHGVEVRSEWSRIDHRSKATGERYRTTGAYALLSYRLPRLAVELRPYILHERLDVAEDDPYFAGAEDVEAISVGLRWDARPGVAVKAELRSEEVGAADRDENVRLQIAVGF